MIGGPSCCFLAVALGRSLTNPEYLETVSQATPGLPTFQGDSKGQIRVEEGILEQASWIEAGLE